MSLNRVQGTARPVYFVINNKPSVMPLVSVKLLESRYNWRHDSILLNIYKTIKPQELQAFVDIGYLNPLTITGNEKRPDFAIVKGDNLLLLELALGIETNIKKNFDRKVKRYQQLPAELLNNCTKLMMQI